MPPADQDKHKQLRGCCSVRCSTATSLKIHPPPPSPSLLNTRGIYVRDEIYVSIDTAVAAAGAAGDGGVDAAAAGLARAGEEFRPAPAMAAAWPALFKPLPPPLPPPLHQEFMSARQ